MTADRRVWRRYATRRALLNRERERSFAKVRRRFRAQSRPKPSWRSLLALGATVFAATVVLGVAVLMARPHAGAIIAQGDRLVLSERRLVGPIRVIDGDTIEAAGERIRIANIDTPETAPRSRCAAEAILAGQATAHLQALISESYEVTFRPNLGRERDAYGRLLGRVAVDGQDVGRAQLKAGLAAPWRGRKAEWC